MGESGTPEGNQEREIKQTGVIRENQEGWRVKIKRIGQFLFLILVHWLFLSVSEANLKQVHVYCLMFCPITATPVTVNYELELIYMQKKIK